MAMRFLRLLKTCQRYNLKKFHTTPESSTLFEYNRRSNYPEKSDYVPPKPKNIWEDISMRYAQIKNEFTLWKEELKDNFRMDPQMVFRPGEVDVKWKFGDPKSLEQWVVTCDSDYDEGNSTATLKLTPRGTALFSGVIDTSVVDDGRRKQAGYCNIRGHVPRKAFHQYTEEDWGPYTHIILRIRGDGRNYLLNLHYYTTFDVMWNDLHHFVLYTRGGPYWQYAKIPFSKFFLSHRGRTQDHQYPVRLNSMTGIGITASDGISGAFNLEIDFVGLECDQTCNEEFAYELYKPPHPYYS